MPNRWIEWGPTGVRIRLLAVFVSTLAVLLLAASAPAVVVTPSVTGPITSPGSAFLTPPTGLDLASLGYVEQEFFVAGTATAYTSADPLDADGVWTATPGDTAGYVTRILVRRPTNPKKFNGTVVVEWLNVSGGRRRRAGLDFRPHDAAARGLRLGGRVGAARRRQRRRAVRSA